LSAAVGTICDPQARRNGTLRGRRGQLRSRRCIRRGSLPAQQAGSLGGFRQEGGFPACIFLLLKECGCSRNEFGVPEPLFLSRCTVGRDLWNKKEVPPDR